MFPKDMTSVMYSLIKNNLNLIIKISGECTIDECQKKPCHHGGKCFNGPSQGSICLCPLGFGGDYCEMRLDLMVSMFLIKKKL